MPSVDDHRAGKVIAALTALAFLMQLPAGCAREAPPLHHSRTSVLLLTLCTVRADHLGSYGYERNISPNLDRLAAEGFRFERVLAQAPWTKSGVATIITGMYPRSLNIEDPRHLENYRKLHDSFRTAAEILQDHGYHTIGVTANPNTAAVFNMDQGYAYFRDPRALWQDRYYERGIWGSDRVNRFFLEHLNERPPGEKFFAHLVYVDPHTPRIHKSEPAPGDDFVLPPADSRTPLDEYDLQISFLDENIGTLLAALKARGQADDLLVIVNSDHGEAFKLQSWVDNEHGRHLYNSTIWVPWLLHHPDLGSPGGSHPPMVAQIDMLPTLLEMLGIPAGSASQGRSTLAGTSRWSDIRGTAASPPLDLAVSRTQFLGSDKAAVLTPEHKLILNFDRDKKVKWRKLANKKQYFHPPELELYRHRGDPLERDEVSAAEPGVVEELEAAFRQWEESYPPLVPDEELQSSWVEVREQLALLETLGYVSSSEQPAESSGSPP